MERWKQFEINSSNYLNNVLNIDDIKTSTDGGGNSRETDIKLYHKSNLLFSIEVKLSPSQSGQFVVKFKNNKFFLSEENHSLNSYSSKIIEVLNEKKLDYNGEHLHIDCGDDLCFKWIKNHYLKKGVEFLITSDSIDSFYSIIPLSRINDFFQVSCVIRKKKSGTSDIPIKDRLGVEKLIKEYLKSINHLVENIHYDNKKMYLYTNRVINKSELTVSDSIFLSKQEENFKYRIKKRSSTNNPNVIFSLKYTGDKKNSGLIYFKNHIIDNYLSE